jgi:two-component system, LuxR family, response regulator FixJ
MTHEPTVFVVDDDEAVRKALKLLIESAGMQVETFCSADEFLARHDLSRPGCLVLDIRMPGMSGLALQDQLIARRITVPVIMITGHGDVAMAVGAVKKGAIDFIQKPFDDQMLLDRVQQAVHLDAEQRRERARRADFDARLARLTPREREVLDLLILGKGNKEVALELGLSRKTIDIHRAHVMMKLGVDSLLEIAHAGYVADPPNGR